MTPTVTWTPERVAELESHLASDKSAAAIGRAMGLTTNTIIGRCWRTGLVLPLNRGSYKIADAELPALHAQRAAGAVLDELAAAYGCTPRAVAKSLKRKPKVVYRPTPDPFPPRGCCIYPHGDPHEPGFRFCGAPQHPGRAYCAAHMAVTYERVKEGKIAA